jgi:hypothetical protein
LTVGPAALTITAANKSKVYGTVASFDTTTPSTDFTVSGLLNSDTVASVSLTSTGAPAAATVSTYPIVPASATGVGLGNYTVSYVSGTLTVTQATLTVTASNKTKTLGEVVNFDTTTPSSDFSVTGLLNSDSVASITLTSTGAAAGASVAGSPYAIVPSAAVGSGLDNYAINYVNGTLTIRYGICAQYDETKSYKKGSTIPIKLTLCDATGANVSSPDVTLRAANITRIDAAASPFLAEDSGNANPDADFRYAGGFYIFNLSTKSSGFAQGSWQINFVVNGASDTAYFAKFDIK